MSNIVVLTGSMRRGGNTDLLAAAFADGAATLPELFDAILVQYKLVLNFFHLEDAGKVLVRGAKDKGDVPKSALKEAFDLGTMIR